MEPVALPKFDFMRHSLKQISLEDFRVIERAAAAQPVRAHPDDRDVFDLS